MRNEGFDQIATGFGHGLSAAEVRGICFYEFRIQIVLANEKAELITETRLTAA